MNLAIPAFLDRKKMSQKRLKELSDVKPVKPEAEKKLVVESPKEDKRKTNTLSVQDRVKWKGVQIWAVLDGMTDNFWDKNARMVDYEEFYKLYRQYELSNAVVIEVKAQCMEHLSQFIDHPEDYTRPIAKQLIEFWKNAIAACDRYTENNQKAKVARKPRKKRAVSADKKVKDFKFCAEYPDMQLVSTHPTKIIGAVQVWLFNHKNMTLTMLNALDRGGFDIKGQTFQNIDENTSITKRVGRKTQEVLNGILKKTKPQCKRTINEISAKPIELQKRGNASTIIMRVF